jgi:hypothetical protein
MVTALYSSAQVRDRRTAHLKMRWVRRVSATAFYCMNQRKWRNLEHTLKWKRNFIFRGYSVFPCQSSFHHWSTSILAPLPEVWDISNRAAHSHNLGLLVWVWSCLVIEYVYHTKQNLPKTPWCHGYYAYRSMAQWALYLPPRCNIKKFYVLPLQCIYVFCVDLRTNSDYFTVQN